MDLVFSGGEPLLRPDFCAVYRESFRLGLAITVLTNATAITAQHLTLFRECPPDEVEVSLFGATEPSYEHVTRVAGSYLQAVKGIHRMRAAGVRLRLKPVVGAQNLQDVLDMECWAKTLGLPFVSV